MRRKKLATHGEDSVATQQNSRSRIIVRTIFRFRLGDTDFATDVTPDRCMPNSSQTRRVGGRCRERPLGIVAETQSQ